MADIVEAHLREGSPEVRGMSPSPDGEFVFERDRGISHLASRRRVSYLIVPFENPHSGSGPLFRSLAEAKVNVFLIKMLSDCLGFAVNQDEVDRGVETLRHGGWEPEVYRECAIVSVVSPEMRDMPGVMARLVGCLQHSGVEIRGFADSFNSVSCLIAENQMDAALEAMENEFEVTLPAQPDALDPW